MYIYRAKEHQMREEKERLCGIESCTGSVYGMAAPRGMAVVPLRSPREWSTYRGTLLIRNSPPP